MRDLADKNYIHPRPPESPLWRLAVYAIMASVLFVIGIQVGIHTANQRCETRLLQATEALRFCSEALDDKNLHQTPQQRKRR
jgi:hypothetical protein